MTVDLNVLNNGVYSGYYGINTILLSKNGNESVMIFKDGSTRVVESYEYGMITITDKYSFRDHYVNN